MFVSQDFNLVRFPLSFFFFLFLVNEVMGKFSFRFLFFNSNKHIPVGILDIQLSFHHAGLF